VDGYLFLEAPDRPDTRRGIALPMLAARPRPWAWRGRRLRAGQEVVVRPPLEILATLDADGALHGVPFMPEMVRSCGKRFRVSRRMEKTCVEAHWRSRRFADNDVVLLDELRCSGEAHDGCRRGCMIFWKEAWLRPVVPDHPSLTVEDEEVRALLSRLKVRRDAKHYYCQSTELAAATEAMPTRRKFGVIPRGVWVSMREVWVGNRSVREVIGLWWRHVQLIWRRKRIGDGVIWLRGPSRKTPTLSLGLEPGERVRIKTEPEIRATLNEGSMNRGLRISVAMLENCGKEFRVRERVDRIISEVSGEMREVENTVSLEGLECLCAYVFGGCPRGDLQYWREIWLERCVDAERGAPTGEPGPSRYLGGDRCLAAGACARLAPP
jgi:hypothetical protein